MEAERRAFAKAVKTARRELSIERACHPSVDRVANNLILDFVASLPFHEAKSNLLSACSSLITSFGVPRDLQPTSHLPARLQLCIVSDIMKSGDVSRFEEALVTLDTLERSNLHSASGSIRFGILKSSVALQILLAPVRKWLGGGASAPLSLTEFTRVKHRLRPYLQHASSVEIVAKLWSLIRQQHEEMVMGWDTLRRHIEQLCDDHPLEQCQACVFSCASAQSKALPEPALSILSRKITGKRKSVHQVLAATESEAVAFDERRMRRFIPGHQVAAAYELAQKMHGHGGKNSPSSWKRTLDNVL